MPLSLTLLIREKLSNSFKEAYIDYHCCRLLITILAVGQVSWTFGEFFWVEPLERILEINPAQVWLGDGPSK